MMPFKTIRAKLHASALGFLTIVVVLATSAIISLRQVDQSAVAVSQKWVSGSQMLGELCDRMSEFRLAEAYRALAQDQSAAKDAEQLAEDHAATIDNLLRQYRALVGPEFATSELKALRTAWTTYLAGHEAWLASDKTLRNPGPARPNSDLEALFKAADDAGDRLMERNQDAIASETATADGSVEHATYLVTLSALCAGLLTLVVMSIVEKRITGPLGAITAALSSLASGCRTILVPESNRADEIGAMAKTLEVFRANAVALVEAQELANTLARHDALTGLPNRRLFGAVLADAVTTTGSGPAECAVMLIDLDRFKPVNDIHGHATGDLVLCEVARRLTELVAASGVVARLGGDEFVLLMVLGGERKVRGEAAIRLAGRIVAALGEPIVVSGMTLQIGASVGIALCPEDGTDVDSILRAADLAMYRAKQDGRSVFRFFEPSMDVEIRERAALEASFRQALVDGDICPFYQPLINMTDGRIGGFEVLARWEHAERGFIPPDIFVPLAEQAGLMGQFTSLILHRACREALEWDPSVYLAVNISPAQFQDPAFPAIVLATLNAENFPPGRLELEVTESALVGDLEQARRTLESLQRIGIKVALDDFGTGYSSLYHLREMKFDKIKIDRSFVQSMQQNGESQKIVDAVLGLAKSLDMPAVAEGIEDETTMRMLADRGCAYGQGYLFSRAVPAAAAQRMLAWTTEPSQKSVAS